MARAKRTNRAEARRRYRAEAAELEGLASEGTDEADDSPPQGQPAGPSARRPRPRANESTPRAASGATSSSSARPGFTTALRSAARPWNLRSDIAYIPDLVLHTRAVWIPALATIASGAYFLLSQPLGSNGIALFLFQLFVVPPTIAGAFLAGVLAPRATYVAGGIAASIGVLVFAFAVLTTPADSLTLQPTPTPSPTVSATAAPSGGPSAAPTASASIAPTPSAGTTVPGAPIDRTAAIIQSIFLSVPFGVLIGGAGGYYRRFLYLSNAGARRRDEQRARQPRGQSRKK